MVLYNFFSSLAFNKISKHELGKEIDREVRRIIDECYAKAKAIIVENRATVQLIAQTLLIHETLTNEQIVHLVDKGYLPGEEPVNPYIGDENN